MYKRDPISKLYYGKYSTRIVLEFKMIIAGRKLNLLNKCNSEADLIESLLNTLASDYQGQFRSRLEGRRLSIFTSNQQLKSLILDSYEKYVVIVNEPFDADQAEFLKLNQNAVLTDKPPRHKYRVYLYGKVDKGVLSMFDNSSDYHIGKSTYELIDNGMMLTGHYCYVSDNRHVTLIKLQLGNVVRKVEELVYRETIDK